MITSFNLALNNEQENFKKQMVLKYDPYIEVYLIKSTNTNKQYILKRIKLDRKVEHIQVNRYTNECNALKKLDNPYIIKYITNFRSIQPTRTFNIIMEYVDGSNLANEIKKKKEFSYLQIIEWIIYICLGLHEIHSNKIIHRNIKPDNLFLTKDNKIKIGNFGISKCLKTDQDYVQTDIGNIFYRAPETFQEQYNKKVDMWSLGVVIYELITFEKPFYGEEFFNIINSQYIKQMKSLPDKVPTEFKELVSKLLSYHPQMRPSTEEVLRLKFIEERINVLISEGKLDKSLVSNLIEDEFEDGYCIYAPDEEINIPKSNKSSQELKYLYNIQDKLIPTVNKSFSSKNISAQLNSNRLESNIMNENQYVQEIDINLNAYKNNDNVNLDYVDDKLLEMLTDKSKISSREDIEEFKKQMTISLEKENKSISEIHNTLKQLDKIYSLLN